MSLSDEDRRSLKYFWETKRDLTRWVDWPSKKKEVRRELPHLWQAWINYQLAEKTMDAVVSEL